MMLKDSLNENKWILRVICQSKSLWDIFWNVHYWKFILLEQKLSIEMMVDEIDSKKCIFEWDLKTECIHNSAVAQSVRLHPQGPRIEPRFGRDAILKPEKIKENSWLLSSHTIRYIKDGSLNSTKVYPWGDQFSMWRIFRSGTRMSLF